MREDLKAAVRSLRKSPTFTAVALVVLALGIGAATALFSVVDAVVLRGLPFDEHDRLAVVLEFDTRRPETFGGGSTTSQTYLDWRQQQQSFEGLAAVGGMSYRLRNESGEPATARAQRVTWEFFSALRVAPMLGRAFTADDEIVGRHRVALISYGFWQRQFGGAPDVVGRTIDLNEEPWEIVGVLPRGFTYPVSSDRPADVFAPVAFQPAEKVRGKGQNYGWTVFGRLKDGVSIEQAHQQMNRVAEALDQQYPAWSPGRRARVISLHHHLVGRVRPWMLMLLGAVGLLLLIACANVANLMLARATARAREVGIRAALGAARWRLVRGLLVEGVVLSLAGAVVGVALAYAGVELIRVWLPAGLPRVADIAIDLRVLGAAIAAGLVTGIVFAIVPAVHAARADVIATLKESGRSTTSGVTGQRVRNVLVVAEVAVAIVLLVGAGLFAGSFVQLIRVDPGFDYTNVLTFNVGLQRPPGLQGQAFDDFLERNRAYAQQVVDRVRALPGVAMAANVDGGLPLTGNWSRNDLQVPGRPQLDGDDESIDRRSVSPDYLPLMRIPLRRGRYPSPQDQAGTEQVIVINEAAARKYFPGEEALGQRVAINDRERVIVGVAGDIRHLGPEQPARQEAYIPAAQDRSSGGTIVVRTTVDPLSLLPAVKAAVWAINPEQRFTQDVYTLEGYMDRLIAQRRFNMAMLVLFGVLGLVITAAGIYGVMAYVVEQRTSEIGLRMALGATPGGVVSMVISRAALLMAIGIVVGATGAWLLSARVQTFLFEVQSKDVRIFALAISVLTLAGLVASAVPARRAARVDPLVALRDE